MCCPLVADTVCSNSYQPLISLRFECEIFYPFMFLLLISEADWINNKKSNIILCVMYYLILLSLCQCYFSSHEWDTETQVKKHPVPSCPRLTIDPPCPSQSMRLQQSPDSLSPDSTIDTSSKRERPEKESCPTQLYRHIKVGQCENWGYFMFLYPTVCFTTSIRGKCFIFSVFLSRKKNKNTIYNLIWF